MSTLKVVEDAPGVPQRFADAPPIRIDETEIFRGCNIYHADSVIRARVEFGRFSGLRSIHASAGFAQEFVQRFRSLKTFAPERTMEQAFIDRLNSDVGASIEEVTLEAILAVEAATAFAMHNLDLVSFAIIEKNATFADLIWECGVPRLSLLAAEVGVKGVTELLVPDYKADPARTDWQGYEASLSRLLRNAHQRRFAPATAALRLAAKVRNMPCEVIGRQHLRVGQGNKQQHLFSATTGTTSTPAQKICVDKRLTNLRLSELRLPVPKQFRVTSRKEAHEAAQVTGFPLVIKPVKGHKGAGVTAGLTSAKDLDSAFDYAHSAGSGVIVEQFLRGSDHRLLVVGGKCVAALTRTPPMVTGDGKRTVQELVDELNADPFRDNFRLYTIHPDADLERTLQRSGVELTSVLKKGRTIAVRSTSNVSTGGTPIDLTDQVHPDNMAMAERAAKGIGLDVAGVDFMTTDISRSYREVGGGIIEMNARPGIDMHIWPRHGFSRDVAGAILNLSFKAGDCGRVPVVTVAGDVGTGSIAKAVDRILRTAGQKTALVLNESSYVNGSSAELTETQQKKASSILLRDPEVEALVAAVSLRNIARRGLNLDQCDVSIILDRDKMDDAADFQTGISVIGRATRDCFIVGLGNTVALNQLADLKDRRLIVVGDRLDDPAMRSHLKAGGRGVALSWVKGADHIVWASGNRVEAVAQRALLADFGKRAVRPRHLRPHLFAVAAALALGLSASQVMEAVKANARAAASD